MIVVLDTSELWSDPWLRSAPVRLLHEILQKSGSRLVLPDVVVLELQRHYVKEVERSSSQVERHVRTLNRLRPRGQRPFIPDLPEPAAFAQAYGTGLIERVRELGGEVSASEGLSVPTLLERALEGRRPFNEDGKKGFRDTLIWEHVLRLASEGTETVVLVTSNTKDFCADGGLHPHLHDDLKRRGIAPERVRVVAGLGEFNRCEAEKHLRRLLDVEDALGKGKHAKLSLASMLSEYEDTITDHLDPERHRDDWADALEDRLNGYRDNIRVDEITALFLEHADIDSIEVMKLDDGDVSISFVARFEVEVRCISDARIYTKHDLDDYDRTEHHCVEIEMSFEVVADPNSGEVRDFSVAGW